MTVTAPPEVQARFEDERALAVAAADARCWIRGLDQPAPMFRRAEQRGKTRPGIEPRPAEPVNRTRPGHQRGGLAVSDEGVVFEWGAHWARRTRQSL